MIQIKTDLIYDKQHQLQTDLYLPTESNNKILVFWHGGGWIRGDKSDLTEYGKKIAEAGFTAFIPNYRLAPSDPFPASHEDTINFITWLKNSTYCKPDTEIVQIGASSGGVLALYIAGKFDLPTVTWSAPVSYTAWMQDHQDVKPSIDAAKELGLTDQHAIDDSFYKNFALTYVDHNESTFAKLDAASYDYQKLGRLLMFNSTNELSPVKYTLDFIASLAAAGKGAKLVTISGTKHAMAYGTEVLADSLVFLAK